MKLLLISQYQVIYKKKDTTKQINIKKRNLERRAAIEPIIGHLKSDHRKRKEIILKDFFMTRLIFY